MISTNLSTRPFYNERFVHTVLVIVGLLVLAVTVANVLTIVNLSRRDAQQNALRSRAVTKAAEARQAALRVRRQIDPAELNTVVARADEANRLIDERTFSWTQLLSQFEETLPADVRITAVSPRVDKEGQMAVQISVVGRRAEDINEFAERLETKGFADVRWIQEAVDAEGLRETTLEGRYVGGAAHRSN